MMNISRIIATGAYAPEQVITNDDLSKIMDTSDEWIRTRSGISQRRLSSGENTSHMAIKVGEQILKNAGVKPEDIELLIIASVTPDYTVPSVACMVQKEMGLVNAVAFDITAACAGFIYGICVADKFIKCGVYKNAIVIGAEILSKIMDWTDRSTCVLFGDGAGGVYLEASQTDGILCEEIGSDGASYEALTAGYISPANAFNDVEPLKGMDFVNMDGRGVFKFATKTVSKSILRVIEKAGISKEEITYVVPHQANIRIVEMIAQKTGIPMEKFYMNIDRYANTSSASIPIALNEMNEKGLLKRGDKLLIAGFGGGLTWGSMYLTW